MQRARPPCLRQCVPRAKASVCLLYRHPYRHDQVARPPRMGPHRLVYRLGKRYSSQNPQHAHVFRFLKASFFFLIKEELERCAHTKANEECPNSNVVSSGGASFSRIADQLSVGINLPTNVLMEPLETVSGCAAGRAEHVGLRQRLPLSVVSTTCLNVYPWNRPDMELIRCGASCGLEASYRRRTRTGLPGPTHKGARSEHHAVSMVRVNV